MSDGARKAQAQPREFASGWKLLVVATLGISMATTAIPFYSLGLFIAPLEQAKGWTRTDITLAATLFGFTLPVAMLGIGRLIDRFGLRRTASSGHFMLGLTFLALSVTGSDIRPFWALYVLGAVLAAGASPVTYTRAIIQHFEQRRGLAIGVAMSGTGIGAGLAPLVLEPVIRTAGWQAGYQVLAAILFAIAILVHIGLRGITLAGPEMAGGDRTAAPAPAQDRRARWLLAGICLIIFAIALAVNGYVVHLMPMLLGAGLSSPAAAGLLAYIGATVIIGRLGTGFLLDRFSTGLVGSGIFLTAAAGIGLLGFYGAGAAMLPILLIGFTVGAEVDIVAYLVSRCFDRCHYTGNFSIVYGAFMLGAALSPLLAGWLFDRDGGYDLFFLLSIMLLLIVSASFLILHVAGLAPRPMSEKRVQG